MTEIVEVETRTFLAHYLPTQKRIEISKFLKDFNELYEFVLKHELKHAQLKYFSFRHIWIDIKDRTKFFLNPSLVEQMEEFQKPLQPKSLRGKLFRYIYELSSFIQIVQIAFLLVPTKIRIWLRRRNHEKEEKDSQRH